MGASAKEKRGAERLPSFGTETTGASPQRVSVRDRRVESDSASSRVLQLPDYPGFVDFSVERALSRVLNIMGALLLVTLFSPLIAAIFASAALTGNSPLFRHRRIGRNGGSFDCLKFRTMVPNAQAVLRDILATHPELRAEWERDHKLKDDPRITRFGSFLRSTSLDELPQLWNVLKGDMSLVGPRPVTREELLRYGRNAVIYMMVRPGITGLWQVSGRNNVEYRRRVAMDVCYVKNQSLVLDAWILLKTVVVVITGHGAH